MSATEILSQTMSVTEILRKPTSLTEILRKNMSVTEILRQTMSATEILRNAINFLIIKLIHHPIIVILFQFVIFCAKRSHGVTLSLIKESKKESEEVNNNTPSMFVANAYSTTDDGSVYTEENGVKRFVRPGEYVQPCWAFEVVSVHSSEYRDYNTAMAIWFESYVPIKPGVVLEALWIVSRNVPHLQLCIGKRGGHFWLKRMLKLEIDFEISTKEAIEVQQDLLDAKYDIWKGPLWKARLILPKKQKENNKFTAVLLVGVLHTITDGVTQINIVREFTNIMNQLNVNKIVMPTFSPIIPPIDKVAGVTPSISFLAKALFLKAFRFMALSYQNETSFSGSFPVPKTAEAKTKILTDSFTLFETDIIVKMCKNEKITVNTFIITLTNLAILRVAQSKSNSSIGAREIFVTQCVNLRRHLESQYCHASGFHIALLDDRFKTSLSDIDDFWSAARKNQLNTKDRIENKNEHLKVLPFLELLGLVHAVNNYLTVNGIENRRLAHYITSNMGNLKNFLPEPKIDDTIKVTHIMRDCSIHHSGSAFLLNFQTLNDRLMISMDYYTNVMAKEIADEIFSNLCQHIRSMVAQSIK